MTKLEDTVIKTKDSRLRLFLTEIVELWNGGKIDFRVVSDVPSDTPEGAEIRLFDTGLGTVRIYFFAPSTGAWYKTADLSAA
jgi:hypothetical protein